MNVLDTNRSQLITSPLAPRDRIDMLVVLLSILEYLEGTTFLTTDRVQSIDLVLDPRIHLSLS